MIIRPYNPDTDQAAAHRIWREVHWIKKDQEKLMDYFLEANRVLVAELHGTVEALVTSSPGHFRYLQEDLKFSAVSGVTTSRVARKQGFASRLTAQLVAADVADGAQLSGLGMFEQGYYDRLGFGTGRYENFLYFDPADLTVQNSFAVPHRLSTKDWEAMHAAMLARRRGHGACNLFHPYLTRAELAWTEGGFGLGYYDEDKNLTHFIWIMGEEEHGPYEIKMLIYQTHDQLLELLALLKSLGDQIRLISVWEPAGIQLQDLIRNPFRGRTISGKSSNFAQRHKAEAFWQVRICDLMSCMTQTHLVGAPVRFNLDLSDPIQNSLDASAPWRGISGTYVVNLGPESSAEKGSSDALPTLSASVGAFTRMWLGIRPASGLSATDELTGPEALLQDLDELLRLPPAHLGWEF